MWRRYAVVVLVLLAINWPVTGVLHGGRAPTTIAHSPLFLHQVLAGNVVDIASSGTGRIQSVFRRTVRVPGVAELDVPRQRPWS